MSSASTPSSSMSSGALPLICAVARTSIMPGRGLALISVS
jgi:hypothetical protein